MNFLRAWFAWIVRVGKGLSMWILAYVHRDTVHWVTNRHPISLDVCAELKIQ